MGATQDYACPTPELLKLEWSDVDMRRKEFTLRRTKNGEIRVVPMTPAVYQVFTELWQERRLDTNRVFLYKEKPIQRIGTAFKAACRRAGITNSRFPPYGKYESEAGRGGYGNRHEDCGARVRPDASAA